MHLTDGADEARFRRLEPIARPDVHMTKAEADALARDAVTGAASPRIEHIDNAVAPYIPAAFGVPAPDPQIPAAE